MSINLLILPLAQAAPEPAAVASFLEVFFYLAGSCVAILVGWRQLYPKEVPSPLTVRAHEEFATKAQLTEVHGRIKRERGELDAAIAAGEARQSAALARVDAELHGVRAQLAANNEAGDDRAEKLHNRINVILESVSELRGELRSKR